MKIKNLVMLFALGAFAFTSCNKEDNGGIDTTPEENFNMVIKFEGLDGTKAETNPAPEVTATLTGGRMFFATDDGTIVRKVEISNYAIPGAVTPQELAAGKLFEDIDAKATFVHVFGNHNFQKAGEYNNIKEIEAEEVDVISQTNSTTWGVENANLYGRGPIVAATAATILKAPTATKEAIFEITPLIARLEIEQFTGGNNIVSFDVEDIFIHNFYEKMASTGALAAAPNNAPWVVGPVLQDFPKYHSVANSGVYDNDWTKYLYDEGISRTSTGATPMVKANTGEVWAYNILANAGADPHIIVKLTNVKVTPGSTYDNGSGFYKNDKTTVDGEAYLTITGYRTTLGKTDILGGNIYRLASVTFDDGDLGETPYPGDDKEKVWVEVTVKKWTLINVEPEFN